MQCIFLFRDAQGRLPTAQELRQRGFAVSEAVLPEQGLARKQNVRALAAEPLGPYGAPADPAAGPGGASAASPAARPADRPTVEDGA